MFDRLWPPLVLVGLVTTWGIIPVIVREVDLPNAQLTAMRVSLSTLFLFSLLAIRRDLAPPVTSRRSVIVTGLLIPVHWFTFFQAIESTRVLVALVLVWVAAPAMAIAATKVLGEPLRIGTGLAVVGGFIGAAVAVDPSNGATTEGVLWALASGGLLAVILLTVKPGAADLGGLKFGAWQGLVSSLVSLPWAIAAIPNIGDDLGLVLLLGVGLTGFSGLIYLSTMYRVPVSMLSSVSYLEPMAAVVAAWLLLDEDPGSRGWIGIGLVVFFGIMVGWSNERAARIAGDVAAGV
ncbi:MAG: DMT family transporter [Acidimicrobiia bacterium]|nr:DMT family transporter [Acidimicrobiia bacterium]